MKEGWKIKKLSEVCDFVRGPFGGSLKKNCFKPNGYAIYEQQHAIYGNYTFRYFIDESKFHEMKRFEVFPNDIIMSCSGTMGKISIVPKNAPKGVINQALLKLTVNKSLLNVFLKYWMESDVFQEELTKYSKGAAIQNVASVKILKDISINLPPLSEQQRIVEILDNAFAKIDIVKQNAERNRDNAKELFQNSADLILNLKPHWRLLKLSEICTLITDGTHSTPKYINKGVPFLSVKNLTKGFLDFSDTRFISEDEHSFLTKRCKPEKEDILYTKVGTTGIAQVINTDREFSIFVSVALLKIKHDIIYNYYLQHALNAPQAREQAKKRTRGTANKNLVITDIKEITVPVPSSLEEQQQIVSKLDALSERCKELENSYQQTINDCDELKKAILAKAFNGEL